MSLQPDTPVEAADLLWALASLCGAQRAPFDAHIVLQQFPPPLDVAALMHAASALGLRVSLKPLAARDLKHAMLPLVAFRRDGASAIHDMQRMLDEIKAGLTAEPRGAVYYSCLGRGESMFGPGSEELKMISRTLGEIPLVGFFANGEISHNRLYGYTGVLTVFL